MKITKEPKYLQALNLKINRLIDQRDAIQKLINALGEQRSQFEKPHYKGEKGNE